MEPLFEFEKANRIIAETLCTKLTLHLIGSHMKDKNFDLPTFITIMSKASDFDYVFPILAEQIKAGEIKFPKSSSQTPVDARFFYPEKIYTAHKYKRFIEKKEYFCELQFVRTKWVFKVARLLIHKGRFLEIGVFVFQESVFIGCFYYGRPVGYGVEFTKHKNDPLASFIVEADFTSSTTFQYG